KVTVEKNATAGNTANLTFTSSANGHLFDSKAKIAVNVDQAANGSISGYILDASQKIGIKNARITLVSSTTGATYTAISDDNGKYTITLPEGNYQSMVIASGYKTVSAKTVNIDAGEATTNIELSVDDIILRGIIKNSVSGENIAETKLYFRQGDNNTTGELVESATTAADGTFSLNLPVGDYTVEITKDGFVTSFKNITITAGNENIEFDGSLSSNESISSS
ncbi:MAG: carboxypeptidase-like regulatory domain-containing protein, partial [Liquorilactobacillus hordei]|uniref:carboxypeptidase-like regulatory domain-containing protein n=1 Tax=Liquorilactobacillus hordei TaxID=468911 RepID=UPI0039ED09B7